MSETPPQTSAATAGSAAPSAAEAPSATAGWPRLALPACLLFLLAVALVATAPHLIVSPAVVSYVLFGFTLWWLSRSKTASVWRHVSNVPDSRHVENVPPQAGPLRRHWPLFVAFILWANCDEWFLL